VAVNVTMVSPIGNALPLAWLDLMDGAMSQSSSAEAVNSTTAVVSECVAATAEIVRGRACPSTFNSGGPPSRKVTGPTTAGYKLSHPSSKTTLSPLNNVYVISVLQVAE